MSFKDDFNLFIGAEYGKFKGVKATESGTIVKVIQSLNHLDKDAHITALVWGSEDEDEILIGQSNQTVKIYDSDAKVFTLSLDAKFVTENDASKGSICGLGRHNGIVVTATESGHIRTLKSANENLFDIYAGGPISKMRQSKTFPDIIGTGGLENELKLWDLNTGKNTFAAKNVPPDHLQLRVKVWVTDHVFMPASDKVVVGSRYGYVRMYDPKAQKRPVMKVDIPDQAVTCITSSNRENTVLCGLAKGNIVTVDLRMGRTSKHYKGFVGAVRDIVCHPTEPYIASVGLDRFVRVHDLSCKEPVVKEYVVSRMHCVLMRSNFSLKSAVPKPDKKAKKRGVSEELLSDGTSDHEETQQLDEMFNSMEKVIDGASKRKQPSDVQQEKKSLEKTPSKKRKSLLVVNPFASKLADSVPEKSKDSSKVSHPKKIDSDSDDDIMILSETVAQSSTNEAENQESEPDEAEGDSDEIDEDSDNEGGSGSGSDEGVDNLNCEDVKGR